MSKTPERPFHRARQRMVFLSSMALLALSATMFFLDAPAADSKGVAPDPKADRMPHRNTLVANVTFVVFDTETTGFSPTYDRIVEIGAVKFRNGKVIDEKTWLINPKRWIPSWVVQVHGISNSDVKNAPTFKDVYPEFDEFAQGAVLMAHNAKFDVSFMAAEMKRNGFKLPPNLVVDSLPLFRRWFPASPSYTLEKVASYAKIDTATLHRALADSMYVYLIFEKALQQRSDRMKLGELYTDAGGPLSF